VGIKHKTVSGLASAEAVMTRQQREAGTAVIDIGAGSTNVIVIEDGEVQHIAVIPVGGVHVTNDLAIGLKTDLDIAESIKVEHASLEKSARSTVSVNINKEQHTFSVEDVAMVVEARIEELLELIDKEFKKINRSKKLPGGVVFTGGGSKIKGLSEYAKEKLELPARKGVMLPLGGLSDIADDVTYATPVGLMLLDMLLDGQPGGSSSANYNGAINAVSKLVNRFKPKR
jgi:cell division protein FtsA